LEKVAFSTKLFVSMASSWHSSPLHKSDDDIDDNNGIRSMSKERNATDDNRSLKDSTTTSSNSNSNSSQDADIVVKLLLIGDSAR
jgi:hypothetical protein